MRRMYVMSCVVCVQLSLVSECNVKNAMSLLVSLFFLPNYLDLVPLLEFSSALSAFWRIKEISNEFILLPVKLSDLLV